MIKLPNLDVAVRQGPVMIATTVPGPHVPCPSEVEEALNGILPDPLNIRKNVLRRLVKAHVDALDELVHLAFEGSERSYQPARKKAL